MYHVFCSLCGVVVSQYEAHLFPLPKPRLSWDHEMNVVCYPPGENRDRPAISGTGLVGETTFRANFDYISISYTDTMDTVYTYDLHRGPDPPAFFFHHACWHMLELRMRVDARSGTLWDYKNLPEVIFHLLRCHPKDRHGVPLTHLDCEASRYRDPYRYPFRGYERALPESLRFVMENPDVCSGGRTIRGSQTTTPSAWWLLPQDRPISNECQEASEDGDPFRPFPPEIVIRIITQLPSTTICNLRLASSAIARKSLPWDFPQSFWESRLAPDSEMAYFFSGDERSSSRGRLDWQALYAEARKLLSESPVSWNRRRIFDCLSYFCPTLESLGLGYLSPGDIPPVEDLLPSGRRAGRWMQTFAPHEYTAQYLPTFYPGVALTIRLAVSFVPFGSRRYISGLCTQSCPGDGEETTLREIGAQTNGPVEHLDLRNDVHFTGVRVYTVSDGVVGLEFFSLEEDLGGLSVGQCFAARDIDVAVAELHTADSSRLAGLVATFDVVEMTPADEELHAVEANGAEDSTSAILWKSTVPLLPTDDISLAQPGPDGVALRGPSVWLNMNFGGPHGERLPLLNRIVAILDMYSGLFKGLEFFYDDGTSAACGSRSSIRSATSTRPCVEMSFVVCGKQGERVTEIRVDKATMLEQEHVRRLHFLTNMGSHHVFESHGGSYPITSPGPFVVFRPAPGHVLTGLVAELTSFDGMETFDGIFGAVGITDSTDEAGQGVRPGYAAMLNTPVQPRVDPYVKREGCWTSAANLQDVSRIRFSTAMRGHARKERHISGLLFHFRNSERVSIVGQWLSGVDSMDIDDGDRLSHVRVYYTQKAGRGVSLRRNNGRVTGMVMSTAKGAIKRVLCGDCEEMLFSDYYANPLEEMDGMTWSFSHRYDRVQIVNTPSSTRSLRFHCSPPLEPRAIHDARRFLWTDTDSEGNEVPLSGIEAFFQEKHLGGLKFVYGTVERTVGECCGERRSISLGPTESITAMDVNMGSLMGDVLSFKTSLQQDVVLLHSRSELDTAKGRIFSRYLLDTSSAVSASTGEVESAATVETHLSSADTRTSAGIWVVPRPSRPGGPWIRDFGPIFLED